MEKYQFKTSHWFDDTIKTEKSIQSNKQFDIVIVGGGYAGLSAAINIKKEKQSASVALIEAKHIGYGASGRNAGWVQNFPPLFWLLDDFNDKQRLADITWTSKYCNESIVEIGQLVKSRMIDCGWQQSSHLLVARNPLEVATINWMMPRFESIGMTCQMYSKGDVSHLVGYKASAALSYDIVTINPYKLSVGLREYCGELGIEVYEQSPVDSVISGVDGIKLQTTNGYTITAGKAVLATNAYTQFIDTNTYVLTKSSAYHTYMFATERLENTVIDKISKEGRPFGDAAFPFYIGRVHDNRFLFNGIDRKSEVTDTDDRHEPSYKKLYRELIRRFPMLQSVPIESAWGGPVMQTSTEAPIIKYADQYKNLILNIGYGGGSGIGMALHSGKLLTGLVYNQGKNDEDAARLRKLLNTSSFPVAGIFRAAFGVMGKLLRLWI